MVGRTDLAQWMRTGLVPLLEFGDGAVRTTKIVLAAAHLDHDPTTNNRIRNLKALCQRCHMLHDHEEHQRRRLLTLRMRNAIGDLFLGLYRT